MNAQLLTVAEAAKRLGVGKDTVYRLIARNELKAFDVAVESSRTNTRVSEDAIEAFLANRRIA